MQSAINTLTSPYIFCKRMTCFCRKITFFKRTQTGCLGYSLKEALKYTSFIHRFCVCLQGKYMHKTEFKYAIACQDVIVRKIASFLSASLTVWLGVYKQTLGARFRLVFS